MKKLLLIAAFSSIYFIFGCTDTNQLAGPDNSVSVAEQSLSLNKVNWISLPQPINKSLRKSWSVGGFINVNGGGGSLHIQDEYAGGPFGTVKVNATITFNPTSVSENSYYDGVNYQFNSDSTELWFSLDVGDDACTVDFAPHIMFDTPATLDLTFEGVDFSSLDPNSPIKFVYLAANNELITVSNPTVVYETGTVQVLGAAIPHFSRYGLCN